LFTQLLLSARCARISMRFSKFSASRLLVSAFRLRFLSAFLVCVFVSLTEGNDTGPPPLCQGHVKKSLKKLLFPLFNRLESLGRHRFK